MCLAAAAIPAFRSSVCVSASVIPRPVYFALGVSPCCTYSGVLLSHGALGGAAVCSGTSVCGRDSGCLLPPREGAELLHRRREGITEYMLIILIFDPGQ